MPDRENIDKLIEMLDSIGETELELGELSKEQIADYQKQTAALSAGAAGEKARRETEKEASIEAEKQLPEEAAEEADIAEGDLTDLLKDIEIGLTEEKELEEQIRKKEEGLRESAPAPEAGEPLEEAVGPLAGEEEAGPVLGEEELEELFEGAEAEGPGEEEAGPVLGEEELEGLFEGAEAEGPGEEEAGPVLGEKEGEELLEGAGVGEPEEAAAAETEGLVETPQAEQGEEGVEGGPEEGAPEEVTGDEEFELPADFDMSMLDVEEGQAAEEPAEMPLSEPGGEETGEPSFEDFEMPDLDEIGAIEGISEAAGIGGESGKPEAETAPEEAAGVPEVPEVEKPEEIVGEIDEFELPEFEEPSAEGAVSEGEGLAAEEPAGAGAEEEAEPVGEFIEGGEEIPEAVEEVEEFEEAPVPAAPAVEDIDIELSEEDIVLITAKLKQISPIAGARIRDLIVNVELPFESLKELLELLILDVPEEDILSFIERTTGEKIVVRRGPEVILARKPGRLAALMTTLGPLVRITALSVAVIGVIGLLFMVFLYRPLRSGKYYREGLEYVKHTEYSQGETYFKRAVDIYPKVKEYDKFGWEYMMSGNYDAAITKFTEGIAVDKAVKNLSIRMHLAMLYNVLLRYEEADRLYDEVLGRNSSRYEYSKAKGRNLIDWGREDPEKFEEAYDLFERIYFEDGKKSDALAQMLYISILRKEPANIDSLYDQLRSKHPKYIDKEIYTKLAEYYIATGRTEPVWNILGGVINRFYDYPPAYFVFSKYFKKLENKDEEETFLLKTIRYERDRKLVYPWDTRDRELLSNAYNNLGELYAGMEVEGKAAESINYFKLAIEENENNELAYFNLAQAYFYEEKNYDLAMAYYKKAQSLGYEAVNLRYNLGFLYYYKKSYYNALNEWMILSEEMPDNPNIKFAMGSAFLHLGKYNSAMGELLMLSEIYNDLIEDLGEIKPWRAYHKKILLGASSVYTNLGVAYQKMYEDTNNPEDQKNSLVNLYKAGEFADIIGIDWGPIQYDINYIIHPKVIHGDMAINERISDNYKFVIQ